MMKVYWYYLQAQSKLKELMEEERGDTNFISIIVILGIVLALAATFSGNISQFVSDMWNKINASKDSVLGNM